MSLNTVTLIGNLGADPEIRYTQAGQAVCELRLATNEKWKDKQGNAQEKVEWHRVICWGKTAEVAAKHLSKGREVCIQGRLQTRDYEDRDGVKRYVTEVICQNLVFLRGGGAGGRRDEGPPPPDDPGDEGRGFGGGGHGPDDDIPFASTDVEREPTAIAPVFRRPT